MYKKDCFYHMFVNMLCCIYYFSRFTSFFISPNLVNNVDGSSSKEVLALPSLFFSSPFEVETMPRDNSGFLTLKEAWGFQTSLYQTVITFLIATNGLIAALSVLYIKTNSEDKAESFAKEYVKSKDFKALVEKVFIRNSKAKIKQLQKDYENAVENLDLKIERVNVLENKFEEIESENLDLKRQVRIISERLANLDVNESEGGELNISRGDN